MSRIDAASPRASAAIACGEWEGVMESNPLVRNIALIMATARLDHSLPYNEHENQDIFVARRVAKYFSTRARSAAEEPGSEGVNS